MKQYEKTLFGVIDNKEIALYTLTTNDNIALSVMTYGATLVRYCVPDNKGNIENIVAGPTQLHEFIGSSAKWGATIGPVAGRIANGTFELNGKTYHLERNNGNHHLHGGSSGFDTQIFQVSDITNERITLTLTVAHNSDGYPGNRTITVTYELSDLGHVSIFYSAKSDQDTLMNMTNHAYFNLSGNCKQKIDDHVVQLNASAVTQLTNECIPTGVLQTEACFLKALQSGVPLHDIFNSSEQEIVQFDGLDHAFYFENEPAKCRIYHEKTNRHLTITSSAPSAVVYTTNFVGNDVIDGDPLVQHSGIAVEMQQLPDAVHHEQFGSIVLKANQTYRHHVTLWCVLSQTL